MNKYLVFFISIMLPTIAEAVSLDRLSTSWNSLGALSTLGFCKWQQDSSCEENELAEKNSLAGGVLLSATESVLDVANSMQKRTIDSGEVNKLFEKGNYSDLLLNVDLNVKFKNFKIGIQPIRYSGSFQLHNPNLPFVSLIFRNDTVFNIGHQKNFWWKKFELSLENEFSYIFRESTFVECSTTELASTPAKDLLKINNEKKLLWHPALFITQNKNLKIGAILKNYALIESNFVDPSKSSLFINNDNDIFIQYGISKKIPISVANFFINAGFFQFQKIKNNYREQWFLSSALHLGPMKLLFGFRPELIRSALEMKFAIFKVGVGQEWKNKLEIGRDSQPRFILSLGAIL